MKILFKNQSIPNYVSDGLFHGLKNLEGVEVVDIPRMDYMYTDATAETLYRTGSKGLTLYGKLIDAVETKGQRTIWQKDIESFDLIIISDINHDYEFFNSLFKKYRNREKPKLCIVDGDDTSALFPYRNRKHYFINTSAKFILSNYRKIFYFKREFSSNSELYGFPLDRIEYFINFIFSKTPMLKSITMSIPEEIIEIVELSNKTEQFVNYNTDRDLESLFPDAIKTSIVGKWSPVFTDEEKYYSNIKISKFGITTKRGGWDCLRHYEYAAKGTLLCFKNLHLKHKNCAPLGLDTQNCITYSSKDDLLTKISNLSIEDYCKMQERTYKWIENYSTKNVARNFLNIVFN